MLQTNKTLDKTVGRAGSLHSPARNSDAPPDVGANLRRLRHAQGYSLETLAKLSGVSRAMLGQIETGKSMPTITLVWKVAKALGIPATALIAPAVEPRSAVLSKDSVRTISSSEGQFLLRAFAHPQSAQPFEFSEFEIAGGHREVVPVYPWGARATLLVTAGLIEIELNTGASTRLNTGDSILYQADSAHALFNPLGERARGFLVVAPPRTGAA